MFCMEVRRICGDTRSDPVLIREIAQQCGWCSPKLSTLVRRFKDLKDPDSHRSKRVRAFVKEIEEAGVDAWPASSQVACGRWPNLSTVRK